MNWSEYADGNWDTFLQLTVVSGFITGLIALSNIVLVPEVPNFPVYVFGTLTLCSLGFFLFLWFQPKDKVLNNGSES